ncbi:hypothetical protein D3C81_633320 [compost metagenome]
MRGVAQRHHAAGDIGFGQLPAQRECRARRCHAHLSQTTGKGVGQLAIEAFVVQRQHALGFVIRQGPDDGTAVLVVRQHRQRAGIEEPLPRGVFIRQLAVDVGHHAALAVVVSRHFQASQGTQRGFGTVQRQHAFGVGIRQGPHDGTAVLVVWQHRQGAGIEETLPRGVFIRQFAVDIGDHAALAVIMSRHFQPSQCAQRGFGTIGSDGDGCLHATTIVQPQAHALRVLLHGFNPRRAIQLHTGRRQCGPQPIHQQAVLDDPAQRAPAQRVGIECQVAATTGIPDPHAPISACMSTLHLRPHAQ